MKIAEAYVYAVDPDEVRTIFEDRDLQVISIEEQKPHTLFAQ